MAILAGTLKRVDPDKEFESHGIHSAVVDSLKRVVDGILNGTADHYNAIRPAIGALVSTNKKIALEVVEKLNTAPRREAALVNLVESVAAEAPAMDSFDTIVEAYEKLKSMPMQTRATLAILRGLLRHKKAMAPFFSRVIALQQWVKDIPDAEYKCRALCMLLLLDEHRAIVPSSLFDSLSQELGSTWDSVDLGWSKINVGFKIVSKLAGCLPNISKEFLSRTEQVRNEIVLDCRDTALSYIYCVHLAIRCFGGLLKRKKYNDEDFDILQILIDRIPSMGIRAIIWSELSLRFYLEGDITTCKWIISDKVRNLLEPEVIL